MTTGYQWAARNKTAQLIREIGLPRPKRNKFNAKKVEEDGYVFDSKREHREYCLLKLRLKAGEIENLIVHPRFELHAVGGARIGVYTADFRFYDLVARPRKTRIIDVKSEPTARKSDFRLRKKLAECEYGIEVEVIF